MNKQEFLAELRKGLFGLPQFTFTATGLMQGETLITNPTISTQVDMKSAGTFETSTATTPVQLRIALCDEAELPSFRNDTILSIPKPFCSRLRNQVILLPLVVVIFYSPRF